MKRGGTNPRPAIAIERVAPTIARLEGDRGVGPLVGMRALEEAMAMARELGTGIVFARNSNHFGAIGPYNYIAAQEGFASIIGSNSSTTIAPHGGSDARVGNSPLGFGVPNPGGRPIILDMAISVVARAKIRDALKQGKPIPDTWATDRDGRPTTDPKAALDGFLLPIGGYKGYGLALVVGLLAGTLNGAAMGKDVIDFNQDFETPTNTGQAIMAIDPAAFGDLAVFKSSVDTLIRDLRASERMPGVDAILVPGERSHAKAAAQRADGIALAPSIMSTLDRLAEQLEIPPLRTL
jgi:LDH2 family malate/lactate/ureidoglycolate dehydrogenase